MLIRVWVSWLQTHTERIYGRSESEGNLSCQDNITVKASAQVWSV